MKQLLWLHLFFFYSVVALAFNNDNNEVNSHTMLIKTKSGNNFKGVLISISDSSLLVFPGNRKNLKKNKYKPVEFLYSQIEEVDVRLKGRVGRGMAIGSAVGVLPLISITTTENSGTNSVTAATLMVPVGAIVGGIVAAKSSNRYWINGNRELFKNFIRQIFQ